MTTYSEGDRYTLDVTIHHTMEPNVNGDVPINLPRGRWVYVPASALRPWTPPLAPEEPTEIGTIVLVEEVTFIRVNYAIPFQRVQGGGLFLWQDILDLASVNVDQIKVVTPEQVRSL